MRRKNILYILPILLCLCAESFAQKKPQVQQLTTFDKKPIRFGFYFGINTMDARMTFYDNVEQNPHYAKDVYGDVKDQIGTVYPTDSTIYAEVGTLSPGFSVGIVTNFRVTPSLDLRILPGMSFGQRKIYYTEPIYNGLYGSKNDPLPYIESRSSYIDLPILIKYKAKRIVNQRPYLVFGPSFHFDLEKEDAENYTFGLEKTSINFDLGVGLDSYMQFFRLSTELKYSIGLNNIIKHDMGGENNDSPPIYSYPIKTFHSHMFTFILYFE